MGRPCLRWTADTERAFVLALRLTGEVRRAAVAIGRHPSVCYKRRTCSPDFAAAWDQTIGELEGQRHAEGLAAAAPDGVVLAPALTRTRTDGWTQQRQRRFLRALADSGRYGEAAARVGLSYESVRAFRRRSPAFQALCDTALIEGGMTLDEAVYTRAVEGWEEPVFHNGELVGHRRRYSDTLAKVLLEREKALAARKRWEKPLPSADEVRAEILRKVAAVRAAQARDAEGE